MKKTLLVALFLIIIPAIFCGCNSVKKRNSTVSVTTSETIDLKLEGDPYIHTVSAYDYIEEFPDLNTSYLEANLPKELQNFLDTDGKFALIAEDPELNLLSLVEFFYNDSTNYRSTNYFAKIYYDNYSSSIIIGRPIIHYDNEEFFIEGFSLTSINKELVRYNWNNETIETIADNADLLGVQNVGDFYYDDNIDSTIMCDENNSFSLYRLGVNSYNFETNSTFTVPLIAYDRPFIDNDHNLIQLKVDPDNLENSQLIVIDTDIKKGLIDYLYDGIGYPSFEYSLYEKNDNSYILYGYNYNYFLLPEEPFSYCYHIDDLDNVFTDVVLRSDTDNFVALHIGNINIPNTNFTGLYSYWFCLNSDKDDEELSSLLNKPFKFSELSEKFEELWTYIDTI